MVNSFLSMAAASLATKKEEEEKPSGSVKHGVDVKDETQKEEQKQLVGSTKNLATEMEKKLKALPQGDLSLCRETWQQRTSRRSC